MAAVKHTSSVNKRGRKSQKKFKSIRLLCCERVGEAENEGERTRCHASYN